MINGSRAIRLFLSLRVGVTLVVNVAIVTVGMLGVKKVLELLVIDFTSKTMYQVTMCAWHLNDCTNDIAMGFTR